MLLTVHGFVVKGKHLTVLALKAPGHHEHQEHEQHLEGGNSKNGKACFRAVAGDACGASKFTQQGFKRVGGRCKP